MFEYFQKMIVRKYQDSTRRQKFFENARRYQFFWGGIPTKNIKKIESGGSKFEKVRFMFFDRYEINIQAFLYFIKGKLIIFRSSSSRNIILRWYILKILFNNKFTKKSKNMFQKWWVCLSKKRQCSKFQILRYENIFFNDDSIRFLYFLKYSGNNWKVSGSRFWQNVRSPLNHQKNIGIWPGTLINHFGII